MVTLDFSDTTIDLSAINPKMGKNSTNQSGSMVFPPFHWGRKREKERRKEGIVTAGLPLNSSIYFSFQSLKSIIAKIPQNLT